MYASNLRGVQHGCPDWQELYHAAVHGHDEISDGSVGGVGRTTVIAAHGTLNDGEPFHLYKKVIERLVAIIPRFRTAGEGLVDAESFLDLPHICHWPV